MKILFAGEDNHFHHSNLSNPERGGFAVECQLCKVRDVQVNVDYRRTDDGVELKLIAKCGGCGQEDTYWQWI